MRDAHDRTTLWTLVGFMIFMFVSEWEGAHEHNRILARLEACAAVEEPYGQ